MANDDPFAGFIQHHCKSAARSRPCCSSLDGAKERYTIAMVNLLVGTSDPIPCESRWTHLLPNFKKSLARRLVNKFSHDMFSGGSCMAAASVQQAGEEAEATSE